MTRRTLLVGALAAAVAAVGAVVWLALPAEGDAVLAPVHELARAAAMDAGAPRPMGAALGARLAASFTAEASVDLGPPFPPAAGYDALVAGAAALRIPAGGLAITILEAEAGVDRRLLLANATVTLRATASDGRQVWGERTYEVGLRRREDAWLIHDVRPAGSAAVRP